MNKTNKINMPIYLGIENEFQLMENEEYSDLHKFFEPLLVKYKKNYFSTGTSAIRTSTGNSLYVDGKEPEVCIPPVKIEKGASTNAVNLLYLARKELVDFIKPLQKTDNLSLIGYSTHWSITNNSNLDAYNCKKVMEHMAIPYSLFCLTPLSIGIGLKPKHPRLELQGDFIPDEDQIRAWLNFYMGTMTTVNDNLEKLPFYAIEWNDNNPHLIKDGRYSKIQIKDKRGNNKEIYAQDYLEIYYGIFKKNIKAFSTKNELKNLDDFIFRKKPLEIDKFKKWTHGSFYKSVSRLAYNEDFTIKDSEFQEDRPLPTLTAQFLSRIVNSDYLKISGISWDELEFRNDDSNSDRIGTIEGIHNFARLERFISCYEKENPNRIKRFINALEILEINECDFCYQTEKVIYEVSKHILNNSLKDITNGTIKRRMSLIGLIKNGKATTFGRKFAKAVIDTKFDPIQLDNPNEINLETRIQECEKRKLGYNFSEDDSLPEFETKMEGCIDDNFMKEIKRMYSLKNLLKKGIYIALTSTILGAGISWINYLTFNPSKEQKQIEQTIPLTEIKFDSTTINHNPNRRGK